MLCEHLGVDHVALFTNGTIALITAPQALRITGEVITTPIRRRHFPLAALERIKPVFVDIDPDTESRSVQD
jgi:dTDP-4-amino-4,6-dideoxygalactose transaminase